MIPSTRSRSDDLDTNEHYGQLAMLDCSGSEDRARQEFKTETDVNYILRRFGVEGNAPQRPLQYGEGDYTLDLQQAYDVVDQTKAAWHKLSPSARTKMPTWRHMLEAMASGRIAEYLKRPQDPKNVPPDPASTPPAS